MAFQSGKLIHPNRHGDRQLAEILEREHFNHPGKLQSFRRVHGTDSCVGPRTAQDGRVEHVGELDIVDVGRRPGNEANVFAPFDRHTHVTLSGLTDGFHL